MAELRLRVGTLAPDPAAQDGDILEAYNSRRIRAAHAGAICHVRKAGFNRDGLRSTTSLAYTSWYTIVYNFRFERQSRTLVKRINQFTLAEDFIPFQKTINKSHPGLRIFGNDGAEIWFNGTKDVSDARLNTVWTAIETNSPEREINYTAWPATDRERRSFLWIAVDDFDDTESARLIEEEYTNPTEKVGLLRSRKRFVDWRALPGIDEADVDDRNVIVDDRGTQRTRASIVETKTAR